MTYYNDLTKYLQKIINEKAFLTGVQPPNRVLMMALAELIYGRLLPWLLVSRQRYGGDFFCVLIMNLIMTLRSLIYKISL